MSRFKFDKFCTAENLPIVAEIVEERAKQDARWGEQNHPMVLTLADEVDSGDVVAALQRAGHLREANRYKAMNDARAEVKADAWDSILLEELHEAFAESDPAKVRAEMVQTAAVCVAIIECIDLAAVTAERTNFDAKVDARLADIEAKRAA